MPVLGADPDAPEKPFPEYTPTVFTSKPVRHLTDRFAYHKGMRMNQRFNEEDRAIMHRFFSQALKRGYSERTLSELVDVFWQTWGADASFPAKVFVSNDMQTKLAQHKPVEIADPWLVWLHDGMPDTVPMASQLRRAVLVAGRGIELRYPDVVADVIRRDGDPEWTAEALQFVSDVVRWHLGEIDWVPRSRVELRLDLPEELTNLKNRAPNKLRAKHDTVRRAIAAIPLTKR